MIRHQIPLGRNNHACKKHKRSHTRCPMNCETRIEESVMIWAKFLVEVLPTYAMVFSVVRIRFNLCWIRSGWMSHESEGID